MNKIEVFLTMVVVLGMVLITAGVTENWFMVIGKVISVTMMMYFGTKILFTRGKENVQKNN